VADALRERGWSLPADLVEPVRLVEHLSRCLLQPEA
jgi:hypothetical protein